MKKTNNKGFSLVELIIVIAIMAILIGVLAPQYIKYVEKSRASADKDLLDSVYKACTTAASEPEVTDAPTSASGWSDCTTNVGTSTSWGSVVADTLGIPGEADLTKINAKLKSKSAGAAGSRSVAVEVDTAGNFRVKAGTITVPEQ